ncbi:hypothetical protein BC831DRAFT_457077 [Entophlyctis helioformis]|nr:hypothetical protein BC831DRAFT_457077 [Entophlyctis helioformis]
MTPNAGNLVTLAAVLLSLFAPSTHAVAVPSASSIALPSQSLDKRAPVGFSARGVRATYYGADYQLNGGRYVGDVPPVAPFGIGACGTSFFPSNPRYFVAMNAGAYRASDCGLCARVSFQGRSTVGPVVDRCAGCGTGIDISLPMFGELVGGEAEARRRGVVQVDFEIIPCPAGRGVRGSSPAPAPPAPSPARPPNGGTLTGGSTGAACTRFGFPCCRSQAGRASATRDANGFQYGRENGVSCIYV